MLEDPNAHIYAGLPGVLRAEAVVCCAVLCCAASPPLAGSGVSWSVEDW
jgi:hypothetical protein